MRLPVDLPSHPRPRVFGSIAAIVLVARLLSPNEVAAQPALACGQTVTGTIAAAGQQDQFTFLGELGDAVSLTLVRTSTVDVGFTPVVTLLGSSTNISNTSGVWFHTLGASGVYTVVIHDVYNTDRGSYSLRLGWVRPLGKQCGDRTTLTCGQEVQASILAPLELDLFNFTGQQGSVALLTLLELANIDNGFQATGKLVGPDGEDIRALPTGTTSVNLPATGIYTLAVHDLGDYTRRGTYSVRLAAQGACPPETVPPSLAVGLNGTVFSAGLTMIVTGILSAGNVPGLVDAYVVLQLPSGQFLSLQLGGQFAPGVVPIVRGIAPVAVQAVLAQYTFTGAEPRGTYRWYAVLATPGTLNFVSPLQQLAFVVP